MTDIMPQGGDFSYQDVDMDIDMGYLDQDDNVYPTVRIRCNHTYVVESNRRR